MRKDAAIAIVGMAGRFPGARTSRELWENVLADRCAIRPLPADRFHHERYYDPEVGAYGKSYSAIGGIVEDLAQASETAPGVDVAHRWALDVARSTFEDAAIDPGSLASKNVGVLIGHARGSMLTSDLAFATAVEGIARTAQGRLSQLGASPAHLERALERIRQRYPTRGGEDLNRTLAAGLAGRVALSFGLSGRHAVVDAACASSFAALDAASRALTEGRLDAALVGGASYSQELSVVLFAQSRALSPDGSFPFDERANGFISSDGLGFFLLMRLEDAIASKARIRAVIRAVGGSCDGKGKALWAPRKEGQVLAMRRAYEASGLDPATIGLLEAHATSTPIGDATEIGALEEIFGAARRTQKSPLPIGSIKGNIGHTREAAGAAGMLKAIYALETATLPPTGSFKTPSKSIPWQDVSSEVITAPRPFAAPGSGPRRAAVNAFGIGGLNYHVILEEPPPEHRVFTSAAITPRFEGKKSRLDVAIVGIGGRFPEAPNAGAFWTRISRGEPAFTEVPAERWNAETYLEPGAARPYRTYTARGGFLRDFSPDWRRYKMPPKLVEQNDPLQFMLLESASDALEDAGIDPGSVDRTKIATIMGTTFGSDYALELSLAIRAPELSEDLAELAGKPGDKAQIAKLTEEIRKSLPTINEDSSGSFSSSTLASRVAKTLDLMGPTYTMDSACAASLASLEAAAELLRAGRVDLAIFGGGDRAMRVQRFSTYAAAGVLSKSGKMAPYEASADGLLPGEGAAVLVLERLEDAQAKGRRIYGIIRGVGSASAGAPEAFGRPVAAGLSRAIERALEDAGIGPSEVSYVEGHGAAVPELDQIELEATEKAYKTKDRATPLPIGSVKRIFGHTAGAAGAMAIAKAALMLDRGTIPPSTDTDAGVIRPGITLTRDETALPTGTARIGVSSMSFGNAHYHVILESAQNRPEKKAEGPKVGEDVVELRAPSLTQLLGAVDGRDLFEKRRLGNGQAVLTAVADDLNHLEERLALFQKTARSPGSRGLLKKQGVFFRERAPLAARTCFLFSGQGSQYGGMLKAVSELVPSAKAILDRADRWAEGHSLERISRVMFAPSIPNDVFWVQATLLVADVMSAAAAQAAGLVPDVVTGHSFGDYAALVVAEAWTLETALVATLIRSRAIEATAEPGGMISVAATRGDVEAVLKKLAPVGVVVPSNLNAPKQTVVSGSPVALDAAVDALADAGLEVRRLAVPRAFHSPLMAGARATLADGLAKLEIQTPRVPYLSSVTGAIETEPEDIRAALVEQLTRPVDFVAQVERLLAGNVGLFVECGPRGVLAGLVEQILSESHERGAADAEAITTDDGQRPGRFALARLAALVRSRRFVAGAEEAPLKQVAIFEGSEAAELLDTEGFEAFWQRSQDSLRTLVRGLWSAERAALEEEKARRAEEAKQREAEAARLAEAEALLASQKPRRSVAPARKSLLPSGPAVVATPVDIPPKQEIQKFLIEALAAQTGYPAELIEPDADLEADLGIDTVKQAQVLGKVRDRYQLRTTQSLSLADFPTVNKILGYVEGQLLERARSESTAPARPRVPVVDLTARRTGRPGSALPTPALTERPAPARIEPTLEVISAPIYARPTVVPPEPLVSVPPVLPPLPIPPGPTPVLTRASAGAAVEIEPTPAAAPETADKPTSPSVILELSGTSRQIGRQHGEALREVIRETMDRYEAFLGERNLLTLAVPEATRVLPSLFDPATLEELHGLAEAVGVPFEHLLAYNLDAALFPAFTPGCTQVFRSARANNGRLLHGANEDSPLMLHLGLPQTRTVQIRRRSDGPQPERVTVLFSLAGQIAGPNAVNDAGITVTGCTLLDGPTPVGLPRGVPHPQLVKQIAEGSRSLADAIAIAERVDRSGRWCLLVSSAAEDRAIALEYEDGAVLAKDTIETAYVSTNHSLVGPVDRAPTHSRYRLERARQLFLEGAQGPEALQDGLRDRFDLARGRTVKHATMSTVRRVDNVMSLVVDAGARRLWVTDRIEDDRPARFLTIDYADTRRPVVSPPAPHAKNGGLPAGVPMQAEGRSAIQSIASLSREGLGLVPVQEVMRRSIVRVVTEEAPPATRTTRPATLLLVGRGAQAEAIAKAFETRGTKVSLISETSEAIALLDRPERFEAMGLVAWPVSEEAPFQITAGAFAARTSTLFLEPFTALQRFCAATPKGLVFAITHLGGGLGFTNLEQGTAEHAGWVGLLKAIRREHEGMEVALLDTFASTSGEQVALALLRELDAGCPRLEVGLLRAKRVRLVMPPRPADDFGHGAERLPRTWLVTGGARGVTAAVVKRLAELYRPNLHLVGRHVLPSEAELAELRGLDDAGLEAKKRALLSGQKLGAKEFAAITEGWQKTIEIDKNLRALRALGCDVRYHAADVADAGALSKLVAEISRKHAVEGILHGAGVEVAKPFAKKTDEIVRATVEAKVTGLVNLLRETMGQPISHVVAFSSVSGRFGGHGQTDYALANEAMSRILGQYRIKRPEARAAAIAWPAWSEVGLAARSSAKIFLEQTGQAFMSPAEGANHFVRELWSGLREPEVTIAEKLDALDLDRILIGENSSFQRAQNAVESSPMLGRLILSEREPEERVITERSLLASEPFLDQHRMGNTPILPAVIGLETLSELAALESDRFTIGEVSIHQPLKLHDDGTALIRAERKGERLRLTMTALRPDGVVLEPDRIFVTASRMARRPIPRKVLPEWDGAGSHYPYPAAPDLTPGSRAIFHGPPFRVVEAIMPMGNMSGLARLLVPPADALVKGSRANAWRVPAALIDGCLQTAGFLARLLFGVFALPAGFGRIDVAPRALAAAGERATLEVQLRAEGDEMVSDLYVALGTEPILHIERYRAKVVSGK
ncbi:MAG: C45 family autoproteolytic acyltransferase/hydrolase [Myxococcota bacterium]